MKGVKRVFSLFVIVFLAATAASAGQATQPERWLHVRVDNQEAKGEMVRINVPLSLAEKVLPAIHNDKLRNGRVTVSQAHVNGVDLRALLDAVRSSRDGEFVTVQGTTGEVRVVKQAGYLMIHVRENKEASKKRVEILVPLTEIGRASCRERV